VFVAFYGGVAGLAPLAELGLPEGSAPGAFFTAGQVGSLLGSNCSAVATRATPERTLPPHCMLPQRFASLVHCWAIVQAQPCPRHASCVCFISPIHRTHPFPVLNLAFPQVVRARVVSVDPAGRLRLSLKAGKSAAGEVAAAEANGAAAPAGDVLGGLQVRHARGVHG